MMRFFKDTDFRMRCLVNAALALLVIATLCIGYGIYRLGTDNRKLHEADAQLLDLALESKAKWDAFREANPDIPVPKVIGDGPNGKLVVVQAKAASPAPTAAPTPIATPSPRVKIKTKTVVHYRNRPTPKPWWKK